VQEERTNEHVQSLSDKGEKKSVCKKINKICTKTREPLISFKPFHSPEANQTMNIA